MGGAFQGAFWRNTSARGAMVCRARNRAVLLWPSRGFAGQTSELDALRRQIESLQQRIETQQRQVSDQADAMRRRQDEIQRLTRELAALTTKLAALSRVTPPGISLPRWSIPTVPLQFVFLDESVSWKVWRQN